ncbi:hypothetical protein DFH05DRAFT_1505539 [Lentinula detonsa]|uniref:Uncharacterized protein n=1 Tax=Lentinula detonsa TaxID=2804962 RepID=A0A9W8NUU0_9AGAR|nr:hypothetical protein DFH05DRAFT_1505539 [Lentinula detonsa]
MSTRWNAPSTKQERSLLLKLDFFILSYTCLVYFTNCLQPLVLPLRAMFKRGFRSARSDGQEE